MNWLLDLGNTRLKCAPLAPDGGHGDVVAIDLDDVPVRLPTLLGRPESAARAWLAAVAGEVRAGEVTRQLDALGYEVRRVRTAAACGSLRIAYAEPARLGVDRYLALVAASRRHDGPWLIVSVGSALTVDLLAADGQHLGGLISVSPEHQRLALATRFPALDVSGGEPMDFAADTADALASGARAAALGLVEHCLRAAQRRLGARPTVLLTGGGAGALADLADARVVALPALVIDGLAVVARDGSP